MTEPARAAGLGHVIAAQIAEWGGVALPLERIAFGTERARRDRRRGRHVVSSASRRRDRSLPVLRLEQRERPRTAPHRRARRRREGAPARPDVRVPRREPPGAAGRSSGTGCRARSRWWRPSRTARCTSPRKPSSRADHGPMATTRWCGARSRTDSPGSSRVGRTLGLDQDPALEHPMAMPAEQLYPAPHSARFDFAATAAGSEWIDTLATPRPPRARRARRSTRPCSCTATGASRTSTSPPVPSSRSTTGTASAPNPRSSRWRTQW